MQLFGILLSKVYKERQNQHFFELIHVYEEKLIPFPSLPSSFDNLFYTLKLLFLHIIH